MLTAIWAVGTANYGTASRHHTTTNWIFLIAYAVFFLRRSKQAVLATVGSRNRLEEDSRLTVVTT